MSKKLIGALKDAVDRRGFLGKTVAASAALAAGVFGFAGSAEAYGVHYWCCDLCKSPTSCTGCACYWGWHCCWNGRKRVCGECHSNTNYCGPKCDNVHCSEAFIERPYLFC